MLEMVQDRIATGVTRVVLMAVVLRLESKWKNYQIITFPGKSLSKNRHTHTHTHTYIYIYICDMLPLESKQSGYKLLHHSDLQGGVFLGEIFSSKN